MKSAVQVNNSEAEYGAKWDGEGVRFTVFSSHATALTLCLFSSDNTEQQFSMERLGENSWTLYIPDIKPGQLYGFRADGPWSPKKGHFYNPNKLVLDPYAKAVRGEITWGAEVYPYADSDTAAMGLDDNSAFMPKSVVVDTGFDWGETYKPATPMRDSIIYELHVKGFTQLHPDVPEQDRGRYLGLTAPAVLEHFKALGVTAIELLPTAYSPTSKRLQNLNLKNYWGYDPVLWFAPDPRFARHDAVLEFKQMVKCLHQAGIEVILDVVFNHTGEEGLLGPSLSFRGLDNAVYYYHDKARPAQYLDFTGCGNSVNAGQPYVRRMVVDCLRYWADEMQVDGFRFDLATTLMREKAEFKAKANLFNEIAADSVLSNVKLIAEPWDLGMGGYQLGQFPNVWSEWNDRYRDTVRAYWRGDEHQLSEMARRVSGSPDIFSSGKKKRTITSSLNFITAHDGFTLRDMVCYEKKHNLDNGEDNRDGHNHNLSRNYGVEGPSDDPSIELLRARQQRNMLATLLLSHGVPMLLAGDEFNRTQQGNNNAYCQDSEIAWVDWTLDEAAESLLDFTRLLIELRQTHNAFRPSHFLEGQLRPKIGYRDIEWLRPDGVHMSQIDWHVHYARFVMILLTQEHPSDAQFLVLLNAGDHAISAKLPAPPHGGQWQVVFDTAKWPQRYFMPEKQEEYVMQAHSSVLLIEV